MKIAEKRIVKKIFFDKFDENIFIWSSFEELKIFVEILLNWFDLIGNIDFFWVVSKIVENIFLIFEMNENETLSILNIYQNLFEKWRKVFFIISSIEWEEFNWRDETQ